MDLHRRLSFGERKKLLEDTRAWAGLPPRPSEELWKRGHLREPPPHSVPGKGRILDVIIIWKPSPMTFVVSAVGSTPRSPFGAATPLPQCFEFRHSLYLFRLLLQKIVFFPASLPSPTLAWVQKTSPSPYVGAIHTPEPLGIRLKLVHSWGHFLP